uniref:Tetratricopeptide repeat protein 27 n=1 Tax=Periophthalmus magnuspinnatus TaxID=409849 RepID=A0A3B4B355_9GOBI
ESTMLGVEISVLRGFLTQAEAAEWKQSVFSLPDVGPLLELFFEGNFRGVLQSPLIQELLCGDSGHVGDGTDLEADLEKRLKIYLDTATEQDNRELVLLLLTVSCLQMFAQSNWTGPPLDVQDSEILPPALLQTQVRASVLSSLLIDGESVYPLVSNPLLLLLSRVLLTRVLHSGSLKLVSWWTLRYLSLHQQILEACSPQLLSLAQSSIRSGQNFLWLSAPLFHLECVYINLSYYEYSEAKEHVRRSQELSGLSVNLTGALGKRTRFQQKSLAQLILEVKRTNERSDWTNSDTSPAPTPVSLLPKDCALNDDTRLEKIKLEDPDEFQLPDLSPEEQAVVLGLCTDFQKNNPLHKLTEEELLAFTSALLSRPQIFSLEVSALSLRTKLERGQRRCVERAMMQTQALVNYFEETNCPVSERLKMFYVCRPPTRWNIQKTLASLLMDLGCTSSALLTFEKLQMWEDVVICHERLGQHGKAEEIVRRELEKQETPSLWCLLGDILREHQYYDRAWDLSKHRSARAMRSKGLLHLQHKEMEQCVRCFEESLRINRMQLGLWFSLGCGYLTLENYEGAALAFQSCVCIEPDVMRHFRTLYWSSLCNCRHRCSWQIWENFLLVSTNIGAFNDAIRAYHRLMDLRDAYKDTEVLEYLVRAVVKDLPDRQGAPSSALKPKLKELLGRVSARHSGDRAVWTQYAVLYGGGATENIEDNEKALQFLSKAHRCELQSSDWHQDPALFKGVLQRAQDTQNHKDVATGEIHSEMKEEVQTLENLIKEIQEVSAALRSQS